jgi:hypothetical protein
MILMIVRSTAEPIKTSNFVINFIKNISFSIMFFNIDKLYFFIVLKTNKDR